MCMAAYVDHDNLRTYAVMHMCYSIDHAFTVTVSI